MEREIITEEDIDENDPAYNENNENRENKKYDESRIYYVYKHVRLDNNTCFYIGKGKGNRKDLQKRNVVHDSICKKHGYKVVTIKKGLNEKEAFKLEADMINCYVSKMGYGIYIKGYMNKENKKNKKFLTNCTWGGEGTSGFHHSEETKQMMSESHKGRQFSEEHKQNLSESHKGKNKGKMVGEKNPMWGKNPYANKTPEEMETISKKKSEAISGENHPMWGKKGKDNPTYGEKNGMWGKPAHNRRKVICITTGKTFNSVTKASNHYKVARNTISLCCKRKLKSAGKLQDGTKLQWMYLEDYNNELKES